MERVRKTVRGRTFAIGFLALCFYATFTSFITYPFIVRPHTTLTAPGFGDVAASVGKYEGLTYGKQDPLRSSHINWLSYPGGSKNNVGVDRVSFLSVGYLWISSRVLGAITSHSLLTFLGYILTAFVTFLFVRTITRSNLAGVVAGFIYGFWPHMYTLARADMTYTHMWLYILPLWAFWRLVTSEFSRTRLAVATISIFPCLFWTPYYAAHVLVIGATFLLVTMALLRPRLGIKRALGIGALVGLCWATGVLAYILLGLSSPASEVPVRTINDIYLQSADIRMYLLPGTYSWGPHGADFLNSILPRANGVSLYVGMSVILLALISLFSTFKPSILKIREVSVGYRAAVYLALSGVIACFLFSLPPTIHFGGFALYTPSVLITHYVPALRAGQRFVMPLMGCLAVLAGLGTSIILSKFKGGWRFVVALVILIVVGRDLWALPPNRIFEYRSYGSIHALGKEPIGPVAQFENNTLINQRAPCLVWPDHKMPLINDCGLGRSPSLGVVLDLPLCDQLVALRGVGTRYLIVKKTDDQVLQCLNSQSSIARTIGEDDTFVTLEYRLLGDDSQAALRRLYNLPN